MYVYIHISWIFRIEHKYTKWMLLTKQKISWLIIKKQIEKNIDYFFKKDFFKSFRQQSFLIPGTRAEGNCQGYENCSSWDPGIWKPYDAQYRGLKTYSVFIQEATGCQKCWAIFYAVQNLLRNANIRTYMIMDIY